MDKNSIGSVEDQDTEAEQVIPVKAFDADGAQTDCITAQDEECSNCIQSLEHY